MATRGGNLQARFIEHCVTAGLFTQDRTVLAAVSGGADSIVLMRLLAGSSKTLGIKLAVGHVNHMIRAEAALDCEFVRHQATSLGLDFFYEEFDVPALAASTGASLEAAARQARYRLLRSMAQKAGCALIATGHSLTDQAETLLMRMIRGTGPLGLAGIAERTADGIVRPLLCLTAREIRELATREGWDFVKDTTNEDEYFLRNRIRSQLMPILNDFNPRIEELLSGLARDAAAISAAMEALVAPLTETCDDGSVLVARQVACPDAVKACAVREAFRIVTGEPLGLSRTHIDALVKMLDSFEGPSELHLPRRVVAESTRTGIRFFRVLKGPPPGSASRKS